MNIQPHPDQYRVSQDNTGHARFASLLQLTPVSLVRDSGNFLTDPNKKLSVIHNIDLGGH